MIGKYIIIRHFIGVDSFSPKLCLEHCLCQPFEGASPGILTRTKLTWGCHKTAQLSFVAATAPLTKQAFSMPKWNWAQAGRLLRGTNPQPDFLKQDEHCVQQPECESRPCHLVSSVMLGKWLHLPGQQFSHMLERKKAFVSGMVKQTPTGPNVSADDKTLDNFFLIMFCLNESTGK